MTQIASLRAEPTQGEPIVRLENVTVEFAADHSTVRAVENFSLDVHKGEFLTIVGPSGCGKSTVLNMLVGLVEPTHGSIYYKGRPTHGINTEIGYVTQEDNLFPWRTAIGSVEFGMEVRGFPLEKRRQKAREMMEKVGLKGFENHYRHQLSGGMRQRVNIVRTLSYEPELILMDEPFGPLDAQTRLLLQGQLMKLCQELKLTVVFITHDLGEAIALADRVVVMSRRPGRVRAVRPVPIERPRDAYTIQQSPVFRELYDELWSYLREEFEGGGTDRV